MQFLCLAETCSWNTISIIRWHWKWGNLVPFRACLLLIRFILFCSNLKPSVPLFFIMHFYNLLPFVCETANYDSCSELKNFQTICAAYFWYCIQSVYIMMFDLIQHITTKYWTEYHIISGLTLLSDSGCCYWVHPSLIVWKLPNISLNVTWSQGYFSNWNKSEKYPSSFFHHENVSYP